MYGNSWEEPAGGGTAVFGDDDMLADEVIDVLHQDARGSRSADPKDWLEWTPTRVARELGGSYSLTRKVADILRWLVSTGRATTRAGLGGRPVFKLKED